MKMPELLKKIIFLVFAKPFVAGETIEKAIEVAQRLKKRGIYVIINILGEHVKTRAEAIQFRQQYLDLMIRLRVEGLVAARLSFKPSQFGLDFSESLFQDLLAEISTAAHYYIPEGLVEIDAEEKEWAEIVRKICLASRQHQNIRLCRQANLKDAFKDIGLPLRICKGAYPGDLQDEEEIKKEFLAGVFNHLEQGNQIAVATQDLELIDKLKDKENLEFQFLLGIENNEHTPWFLKIIFKILGIKNDAAIKLAQGGAKVGIYIPCGPDWYSYGKRRWKSIPKIFWRNWWYRRRR